jgi:hypothetical protein
MIYSLQKDKKLQEKKKGQLENKGLTTTEVGMLGLQR